jgi:hypothetical protein
MTSKELEDKETKKKLAIIAGFDPFNEWNGYEWYTFLKKWNPHINESQFKEVLTGAIQKNIKFDMDKISIFKDGRINESFDEEWLKEILKGWDEKNDS